MGRKEWKRFDFREQVMDLVRSGRTLSEDEIQFIKEKYSGAGGLVPSNWSYGQFFTPPNVVSFLHDLIGIKLNPGLTLEPSVGGGAFLNGLDESLCTGIEMSRESASVASICYPDARIINEAAETIFPYSKPSEMGGKFDYVIGNPPFGVKMGWTSEFTQGKFKKLSSEAVFLEIAYRACRPGGKIALILPDGLLSNPGYEPIRKWMMQRCFVRASISLPSETFYFTGASVKTSILFFEKFAEGVTEEDAKDSLIFMAIVEKIGWDSRGRLTNDSDLPKILAAYRSFAAGGPIEILDDAERDVIATEVDLPVPAGMDVLEDKEPANEEIVAGCEKAEQISLFG
jgi:type I restriction enzyme M protein